ncbi:MAG: DUF4271 domain-containing protein [Paludibacteraceae bacterium]|nr:DUF4271 domain-containing protein [Paludibacteraceae bacterium]
MGEGIAHIISPASAAWCAWAMLVILICGILGEIVQPGVITQAKSSLLAQTDRVYKDAPTNFMGQLLISIFRLGVMTMGVYLCCATPGAFSFTGFWAILGIVLAVTITKMLCNICVDYTFLLSRRYGDAYEHYGNIFTLVTLVLYPVLLILMRYGAPEANRWVLGTITIIFLLLWVYRAFRQFVSSPRALSYLLLYFCTVEILSWGLIYMISNQTISHI